MAKKEDTPQEPESNKRGSMYRPATVDTMSYIESMQEELQISWNAAVNMLVRLGIRAHSEGPAGVRNGGHF